MNIFISSKPFYYHSHPFESVRLFTYLWTIHSDLEGVQRCCSRDILLSTMLFKDISQWQSPKMLHSFFHSWGCSSELFFRPVFSQSGERVTEFHSSLGRLCGWLGTPSCKRDAIMHSAHSCWEFTVFHSGFCLNSILIVSAEERNIVSGSQCVTVRKNTWFVMAIITTTVNYCIFGREVCYFIFIGNITIQLSFWGLGVLHLKIICKN